jgi:hypothetical protein
LGLIAASCWRACSASIWRNICADPDAVKPNASCIATISNGKISARIRYTETATRFGGQRPWMLCPSCSRRCRVLFLGFGRVACRRCFRVRYQSQTLDRIGRALHAMGKIAKQIDPEAEMDLPDKPPGMHWSRYNRLAERFEHQNNVWTLATMRRLGIVIPRLQRRS